MSSGPNLQELLRNVVVHAPVVVFALDLQGTVTLSEGRALEKQGFRPQELVGRSIFEVYRDYPEFLAYVRRALAGEQVEFVLETFGLYLVDTAARTAERVTHGTTHGQLDWVAAQ